MNLADYRDAMQATADYLSPPRKARNSPQRAEPRQLLRSSRFMFQGMYLIPLAPRYTIGQIQAATAAHFGLPFFEMMSDRRSRAIARPRQVAMYLSRHLTPKSLPEIALRFGGRDHTTIIHGVREITRLRIVDAEIETDIVQILRSLGA